MRITDRTKLHHSCDLTQLPPCLQDMPAGTKPNGCAAARYWRVVENHTPLYGPWAGWRLAGRDLVSPDRQRIGPQMLAHLLFREQHRERTEKLQSRSMHGTTKIQHSKIVAFPQKVDFLPSRERFDGCA